MKKVRFLSSVVVLLLASLLILSSCAKNNKDTASSDVISSEITASENVTSVPDKEAESLSSTPEVTSKPSTSKPAPSPKPDTSSKPQVTSKPVVSTPPKDQNNTSVPQAKTPKELIIGKWTATVDVSQSLSQQGFNVTGPINVKATYEFTPNSTAVLTMDKQSFTSAMRTILNKVMQDELTANNLTQAEFEAQIGMTLDEYIDTSINSVIDSFTSFVCSYKFEGEKLFIKFPGTDSYTNVPYSFNGEDKLTLTEDSETITYTRVK